MIRRFYDGSTPWMVAAQGDPHLKTIVPASGVPDLFTLLYGRHA
jgi:predicted acyl esterase